MKTAIVIASGPSLTTEQIDTARKSEHFTIVVNATFRAMPDADALYAGDFLTVKVYREEVRKTFRGKCYTQDSSAAARWPEWERVRGTNRDGLGLSLIHLGGNSGYQAINLAFLWGYRRIILFGFDMKLGPKGERHHHPDHPAPCVQNQVFSEWLFKFSRMAIDLKAQGVEVLNATPGSALTCFPMVDWREVLA